jgi:hypothetical protein
MPQCMKRLALLETLAQAQPPRPRIRVTRYQGETTEDALRAAGYDPGARAPVGPGVVKRMSGDEWEGHGVGLAIDVCGSVRRGYGADRGEGLMCAACSRRPAGGPHSAESPR